MRNIICGFAFLVAFSMSMNSIGADEHISQLASPSWQNDSGIKVENFGSFFLRGTDGKNFMSGGAFPEQGIAGFSDHAKSKDWYKKAFKDFSSNRPVDYDALLNNIFEIPKIETDEEAFFRKIQSEMIARGKLGMNIYGVGFSEPIGVASLEVQEPKTNEEILRVAPQVYSDGAMFGENFLKPRVSEGQLRQWFEDPVAPVDLKKLGLPRPNGLVDAYVLSNKMGEITELILQPHGVPLSEAQKAQISSSGDFRKRLAKWGTDIFSSIQDAMAATVESVCKSAFRPDQFTVEIGGEGSVLVASLAAKVSAKFDTNEVCAPFAG
ncbi:hypothetical protein [Coralliovum pocilloporae]|uniref:hypothetical protein n=1 Tax=Coralliovum pocilloporae TaxID=3066369 RepID=UPI003307B127